MYADSIKELTAMRKETGFQERFTQRRPLSFYNHNPVWEP